MTVDTRDEELREQVFIELGRLSGKVLKDNPGYIMPTEHFKLAGDNILAALTKHIREARINELDKIELAQQDEDKWSNFCMDDTSDFGNYIAARKAKLQQEGES